MTTAEYKKLVARLQKDAEKRVVEAAPKRRHGNLESQIQRLVVTYFRYKYPQYEGLLFAVPNGGRRDKITGKILNGEGVVAGVADLILLIPNGTYSSLCIEVKTETGRQQESQKKWQAQAESVGNKYVICRSYESAVEEIDNYLLRHTY